MNSQDLAKGCTGKGKKIKAFTKVWSLEKREGGKGETGGGSGSERKLMHSVWNTLDLR